MYLSYLKSIMGNLKKKLSLFVWDKTGQSRFVPVHDEKQLLFLYKLLQVSVEILNKLTFAIRLLFMYNQLVRL